MWAFLRSSVRFVGNVTKRSLAGIVWWLLDVADLYSKLIEPNLSVEWVTWLKPYAEYLNVATPFIVAAIVIWAILYTYYDLDKRTTRNPEIPRKLQEFYVAAEPFANFNLNDEQE